MKKDALSTASASKHSQCLATCVQAHWLDGVLTSTMAWVLAATLMYALPALKSTSMAPSDTPMYYCDYQKEVTSHVLLTGRELLGWLYAPGCSFRVYLQEHPATLVHVCASCFEEFKYGP